MKGNIGNMMKQAQQLQANMQRSQAEIASLEVTGEAGGGMAKVTMTGRHEVRRVSLVDRLRFLALLQPVQEGGESFENLPLGFGHYFVVCGIG